MMNLGFEAKCSRSKSFCNVHDNILHNLSKEAEKDKGEYSDLPWKIFILPTDESSPLEKYTLLLVIFLWIWEDP